jgi:hypothetical protein
MDSLQEILGKKNFQAPDEMTAVKNFIKRRYKSPCRLKMQRDALIVSVPNSALAATIYLEREQLIKACGLKSKLVVRTG